MPTAIFLWVWFCAYLNGAGWALSALHELNAGGYVVVLALGVAALVFWRRKTSAEFLPRFHWQKIRRRFRRGFPRAFLILAAMAFLGGALHAPNNYDALAYRVPRMLHWLAAGQWQWIHTVFPRINNRSCGIEWVSAPFIALFKTDRFLFLINFISFVFLPGLVFSIFTRLGVRRHVAWHWMWLVPTGYCFLLQAGSIANDVFGAPFALAAVDFALRAKISRAPRDFFTSMLAAAMMTSVKTSSLPLLLPWAVAILPSFKLIFPRPLKTFAVCLLALFASVLPTIILNAAHSGDWSGAGLNRSGTNNQIALRTGANVILITIQNLVPPVFPLANEWNRDIQKIIPAGLTSRLHQTMTEREAAEFTLDELQMEENAGLGFGVSLLLLASIVAARFAGQKKVSECQRNNRDSTGLLCVRWSPFISLFALMTQYGLSVFCRILTPYYALLLPALLTGAGHERLLKKCWWRAAAYAVFFIAGSLLVVSPARPLFPIETILAKMPNAPARVREVYTVYHERNDAFAPARAILPPDVKVLGMTTFDDPETSLWRPFGSRRIEHVCPADTSAYLKSRGIEYILVRNEAFGKWFSGSLDDWLKKMKAQVVLKFQLNLRAAQGPMDWYLVKLN
jgi:hypothetical protein